MNVNKHYPIGQVCKLTDLPHSTIRFWEKTFPGLKPARSSGGHRYYTAEHVELLNLIKKLLHEDGLTIEGAKKYLAARKNDSEALPEPQSAVVDEASRAYVKGELKAILDFLNKY